MAKDVTISGAEFEDVPGVEIPLTSGAGNALFLDADGYVPVTRRVNGKPLSGDVSLNASDVGASASGHSHSVDALTIENKSAGVPKVVESMFDFGRADHYLFLPPDQIIIEQSTDGGATWQSASVSDDDKRRLFSGNRDVAIRIPRLNGVKSTQCKLRITITAMKYAVPNGTPETEKYAYWNTEHVISAERYCNVQGLFFWLAAISDRIKIDVYAARGDTPNAWVETASLNDATGWNAGNFIKPPTMTFGGSTSQATQYWNHRFVFSTVPNPGQNSLSTSYASTHQAVYSIKANGSNMWTIPNQMAYVDHLYKWDINQNAMFPAKVYAQNNKELATVDAIPTASVSKTGSVTTIQLGNTTATVNDGAPGTPGAAGHSPVKGTDYWTQADKDEITQYVLNALPIYDGSVS